MYYTTLDQIQRYSERANHLRYYEQVLNCFGNTKSNTDPIHLKEILDNITLGTAIWCVRSSNADYKTAYLFGVVCIKPILHLVEDKTPDKILQIVEDDLSNLIAAKFMEIFTHLGGQENR